MSGLANGSLGPLRNGQTVAVVGGGPAGAGCAIMLRRLAARKRIPLNVSLFENKDFAVERNICVGVLSPPFGKLMSALELSLPRDIIQRRIKGYALHSKRQTVYLEEHDDQNEDATVVVDRADLDRFLKASAQEAGATVIDEKAIDIMFEPDRVLVVGSGGARISADAVVGAFGLDEGGLALLESRVPGFRRPKMTRAILTEVAMDEEVVTERMGDTIHALLTDQVPRIEFGALTPKRSYVTVNIAGENITDEDLDAFLDLPWSRKLVPEATRGEARYYAAFPSAPSQNLYADRVITIGNTSGLLRPLKGKGINTGIITGVEAAHTMMEVGISKRAFDEFYRRCHHLTSEFGYGIFLRWLYRTSQRLDILDAVIALSRNEPLLNRAFRDMVSGEGSYKEIVQRSARPGLLAKIILAIARHRVLGKRGS